MLLSNGAGAADVTATMLSVVHACGLRGVTADVMFTQVSLNYQRALDEPTLIQVRHVTRRDIDYEALTMVDHLVRDLVIGRVTRDEARDRLNRLLSTGHRRPRWAITCAWGVMGAGVALVLGADAVVTALAFVAAVLIDRSQRYLQVRRLPFFYQQVFGGFLATLVAVVATGLDVTVEPSQVVTSGIIILLAGIGFMGATQDALTGFPITAAARMLEVVLATAGIIAGVSLGLALGNLLRVGLGQVEPGVVGFAGASVVTFGAALSAAAFAFASYAPLRTLVPVAAIGGMGSAVFSVVNSLEVGRPWASAVAAVLIGSVSYSVAGRVRLPPLVVVIPAIVPLLPGLAIYRGLALLSEGEVGMLQIAAAGATAIALAAGVILGQYVAQPLRREARRLETRLSGPRLVGPMRIRAARRRSSGSPGPQ